jgi:hypothetical protein
MSVFRKTQTIINGMRKTDGGDEDKKAFIEAMNKAVTNYGATGKKGGV